MDKHSRWWQWYFFWIWSCFKSVWELWQIGLYRRNHKNRRWSCCLYFRWAYQRWNICNSFWKAPPDIQGAYPIINQEFTKNCLMNYKYVNREEDLGLEASERLSNPIVLKFFLKMHSCLQRLIIWLNILMMKIWFFAYGMKLLATAMRTSFSFWKIASIKMFGFLWGRWALFYAFSCWL